MSLRPASHAGSWYSEDAAQLNQQIELWMKKTNTVKKSRFAIGPHAGYRFCGAVLAHAYSSLVNYHHTTPIKRIVLMGPSHVLYFRGIRTTGFGQFETPWEAVDIDPLVEQIIARGDLEILDKKTDIREHSWEMHLPYIAKYFSGTTVIPLLFGQPTSNNPLSQLATLVSDDSTAFVVSSDFCHWGSSFDYTPFSSHGPLIYKQIKQLDLQGCDVLGTGNAQRWKEYIRETENTVCGNVPIEYLLEWGEKAEIGLKFELMSYDQSSKVRSANDTSVSYAALIGNF